MPLAHDAVPQSASATIAVAVASTAEKLNPLIVAVAPPLVGALPLPTRTNDTAGAVKTMHRQCNYIYIVATKMLSRVDLNRRT